MRLILVGPPTFVQIGQEVGQPRVYAIFAYDRSCWLEVTMDNSQTDEECEQEVLTEGLGSLVERVANRILSGQWRHARA